MPAPFVPLIVLFFDTHNVQGYKFDILGPDPANPAVVRVRATPPAGASKAPAITVRVYTVRAAGGTLLLDLPNSGVATLIAMPPREKSLRERVQHNLTQLSLAMTLYSGDHGDLMPDADKWVDEILPYVEDRTLFRDPAAPGRAYGFAFNRVFSHKSLFKLEGFYSTAMLFESTKTLRTPRTPGNPSPGLDGTAAARTTSLPTAALSGSRTARSRRSSCQGSNLHGWGPLAGDACGRTAQRITLKCLPILRYNKKL